MTSPEPNPSALRRPFVVLIILLVLTCIAVVGMRAFLLEYAQPLVHPTSNPGGAPPTVPPTPADEYPFLPAPLTMLFLPATSPGQLSIPAFTI